MVSGVIYNIQRYSTHDGPGIRTTVFMKGCPLACWWCHNPEGRSQEPEHSIAASRCIGCGECVEACPEGAALLTPDGPANAIMRPDRKSRTTPNPSLVTALVRTTL